MNLKNDNTQHVELRNIPISIKKAIQISNILQSKHNIKGWYIIYFEYNHLEGICNIQAEKVNDIKCFKADSLMHERQLIKAMK